MISTRDLTQLPDITRLRKLLQSIAMLDAILSPDWESRYYSFNSKWSDHSQMGSMRDGSGDSFFVLFNAAGCFLKGFAHESEMTPYRKTPKSVWPGVLDFVPKAFEEGLNEPAFEMEDVTYCIWRATSDSIWNCGKIEFPERSDPDGSADHLKILDGNPETYQAWASKYYRQDIEMSAVQKVYEHQPISKQLVALLNPEIMLSELKNDIQENGYPS